MLSFLSPFGPNESEMEFRADGPTDVLTDDAGGLNAEDGNSTAKGIRGAIFEADFAPVGWWGIWSGEGGGGLVGFLSGEEMRVPVTSIQPSLDTSRRGGG